MKKIYLVGIITIFFMISCSYKPIYKYYDPQLGSNYVSREVMSNLKLIQPEGKSDISDNFAFIISRNSSIEMEREDYLLLCPIDYEFKGRTFTLKELKLYNSVYFNKEKLIEFIEVLKRIMQEWDKELASDKGIFYNFVIHEKIDYIRSEEVSNYDNKLNIQTIFGYEFSATYQKYNLHESFAGSNKTSNGLFIDGRNFPILTIEEKETVKLLLDVLEICLAELPEEIIPEEKDTEKTEKAKI